MRHRPPRKQLRPDLKVMSEGRQFGIRTSILGRWAFIWHERGYARFAGYPEFRTMLSGDLRRMKPLRPPLKINRHRRSRRSIDEDIPF